MHQHSLKRATQKPRGEHSRRAEVGAFRRRWRGVFRLQGTNVAQEQAARKATPKNRGVGPRGMNIRAMFSPCAGWLLLLYGFFTEVPASKNAKGTCLLTSLLRHLGEPVQERFQHAPSRGVHRAPSCSVRNFQGFEKDSSRSYAKLIVSIGYRVWVRKSG